MKKNIMPAMMAMHASAPMRPPTIAPTLEECAGWPAVEMGIGAPDIDDVVEVDVVKVGFVEVGVAEMDVVVLDEVEVLEDSRGNSVELRVVVKPAVDVTTAVAVVPFETIAKLVTRDVTASVVVAGVPATTNPFDTQ